MGEFIKVFVIAIASSLVKKNCPYRISSRGNNTQPNCAVGCPLISQSLRLTELAP